MFGGCVRVCVWGGGQGLSNANAWTTSLVNPYFFLNYLRYAMFLYYGTPWTFNMILRLLKEHKSAHISVFFTHWRVKSLLVEV